MSQEAAPSPENPESIIKTALAKLQTDLAKVGIDFDPENPKVQDFAEGVWRGYYSKPAEDPDRAMKYLHSQLRNAYENNNEGEIARLTQEIEGLPNGYRVYGAVLLNRRTNDFLLDVDFVVGRTISRTDDPSHYRSGHFARVHSPMIKDEKGVTKIPAVVDAYD